MDSNEGFCSALIEVSVKKKIMADKITFIVALTLDREEIGILFNPSGALSEEQTGERVNTWFANLQTEEQRCTNGDRITYISAKEFRDKIQEDKLKIMLEHLDNENRKSFITMLLRFGLILIFIDYLDGVADTDADAIDAACKRVSKTPIVDIVENVHNIIFGYGLPFHIHSENKQIFAPNKRDF